MAMNCVRLKSFDDAEDGELLEGRPFGVAKPGYPRFRTGVPPKRKTGGETALSNHRGAEEILRSPEALEQIIEGRGEIR